MKYYFIYNPIAGSGKKLKKFKESLDNIISSNKYDITTLETTCVGDAIIKAKTICDENRTVDKVIFACGGDGTMNEVLNGIIGYDHVSLGIIPIGSCNDFLKTFDNYDFMDIEKQINGTRKKIDVMKVNDFYSINVTNAGFDARVNYDQILYRSKCKTVKDAYNKAIIHNIMRPKGQKIKIICDNEIFFEGNNLLLAVGNGSTYGGGYKCAPYAVVNDGLLEVVSVKNVSVIRFAPLIKKYKEGNHLTPKLKNIIKYKQAKNIVITSSKIMTVTIDGETIHSDNVTINVLPNEISFVFPSK